MARAADRDASGSSSSGDTVTPAADTSRADAARAHDDATEDELLTPGEVASMFGVDPKTVSRWADAGKLDALRTLGGHRRYRAREVEALLREASS